MTGGNLLLSQFIQYLGSAGTLIADYLVSRALLQFLNQLPRESGFRKCHKGLHGLNPHQFPMPCHGILAAALLVHDSIISGWL